MVALSQRKERFCKQYAFHGVGTWAAQEAGYAHRSARQQAHRLLTQGAVRARIAELRTRIAAEATSREALLAKLNFAYEKAMMGSNPSVAVRALALHARLTGMEAARPRLPVERAPVAKVTRPLADVRLPAPRHEAALAALMDMHKSAEDAARALSRGIGAGAPESEKTAP